MRIFSNHTKIAEEFGFKQVMVSKMQQPTGPPQQGNNRKVDASAF